MQRDPQVRAAQEKLAADVVILDMRPVCSYTDFFVVCTGGNPRQTKAIHDEVHARLKKEHGLLPRRVEGEREARWILADYLDVVLHVFTPEAREYYRLEREWNVTLDERLEASTAKNLERIEPKFEITPSGEQWFDLGVSYVYFQRIFGRYGDENIFDAPDPALPPHGDVGTLRGDLQLPAVQQRRASVGHDSAEPVRRTARLVGDPPVTVAVIRLLQVTDLDVEGADFLVDLLDFAGFVRASQPGADSIRGVRGRRGRVFRPLGKQRQRPAA